ncbi:hypothetical protein [Paenibacillus sanguinis]|uniref:hypothetical protein n=1 Tax=Paenibacillus sanguinis TaxID=225906 RepID=UPI00036DABF7|nr:hypothetical protein [Paenibacillus sanguinis]
MNKQNEQHDEEELGYLFNVDILIKGNSNALALQSLLELLNNNDNIIDYRINSGSQLGKIIESMLANSKQAHIKSSHKHPEIQESPPKSSKLPVAAEEAISSSFKDIAASEEFQAWIQNYINNNRLVRLYIKRNGKRINIPCRILNFQPEVYTLSVYHVDEKQVYTLKLSEVIDFLDT